MGFDDGEDRGANRSGNARFADVVRRRLSRRAVLHGAVGTIASAFGHPTRANGRELLGFTAVPVSTEDRVVIPPGYSADVLYAWGDPISDGPAFRPDARNTERAGPARPTAVSAWPDGRADGRPRSATVVIRKHDGGLIGT